MMGSRSKAIYRRLFMLNADKSARSKSSEQGDLSPSFHDQRRSIGSLRRLIGSFKRTRQFVEEDYELLASILRRFRHIVTTPNVLTEVNSLSGQMGDPKRGGLFQQFAEQIQTITERYVESARLAQHDSFVKLGLTDVGIFHLAAESLLVLTDDYRLSNMLNSADQFQPHTAARLEVRPAMRAEIRYNTIERTDRT